MSAIHTRLSAMVFFLVMATHTAAVAEPLGRLKVGQRLPDLELPLLADGTVRSTGHFFGRKTVLHIFASW